MKNIKKNAHEVLEKFNSEGYLHLSKLVNIESIEKVSALLSEEFKILEEYKVNGDKYKLNENQITIEEINAGNVRRETKGNPIIWDILRSSINLLAILKIILQSDKLYMHMYPTCRIIRPNAIGALVPAHVDKTYNNHLTNFVTVWLPIDAFDPDQGGLDVWPGSHRLSYKQEKKSGLWYDAISTDADTRKQLFVQKGDCVILHENAVHASRGNYSNKNRKSLDMRLFGSHLNTSKHYLDIEKWVVIDPRHTQQGNDYV